jgi:hypothetical protein
MKEISSQQSGLTINTGNLIKEGKNIIYINFGNKGEERKGGDRDRGFDYIDKKYDEGWEIVGNDRYLGRFILHKKDRSVRKEPRSKPRSKKESSVKVLL